MSKGPTDQNNTSDRRKAARSPRRYRRFRVLLILSFMLGAALISAFWMKGREIVAPDWLEDQFAARLESVFPDMQIRFGDIVAVIDDRWLPQFFLRNVEVDTGVGGNTITFSNVSAGVDLTALKQGQITLDALSITGVLVTLRRSADGDLAVSVGRQITSSSTRATNLAELIGKLDEVFLRPVVAGLKEVDVRAVTLRYEDARAERAWTVDGGRIRLDREGSSLQIAADLAILSGNAEVATLAANYSGTIGEAASDFGITLNNLDARDIASQGPAFSWLSALEAPISGALRGGTAQDGTLRPMNAAFQIGSGVVQPTQQASPIPIDGASSYFTYVPETQSFRFDQFTIRSKWGSGNLEGKAVMSGLDSGQLNQMVGQFRLDRLVINPADLYPEPVEVEGAEIDFRLTLSPFSFELGRVQISDKGQVLNGRGTFAVDDGGWQIALDGGLDGITVDRLKAIWPERLKPKSRQWMAENVYAGQIGQTTVALRMKQGGKPRTYMAFDFEQADVRFMRQMPLIQQTKGHASLVKDRFIVVLDKGIVTAPEGGEMDISGSSFIIPDATAKPDPPAIVRLTGQSSVTASLSLLDQPPLNVMQKTAFPVDVAQGLMRLDATISMPLRPGNTIADVQYDVTGEVADVSSTLLVRERLIEAERLDLSASETGIEIAGSAMLDAVPMSIAWRQPFGEPGQSLPGQVTGRFTLTTKSLETFGVLLPNGLFTGETPADFVMDLEKDVAPKLKLVSDLQGARLSVPQIGWSKPAGAAGTLTLAATLGVTPKVDAIEISASGLSAAGEIDLTSDRKLDRIRFDRLSVGGWLNAPVDLVARGEGQPLGVSLKGGTVDLRKINLPERDPNQDSGSPLSVALERLQVTDTIAITEVRGNFTTAKGLAGSFSGRVNGRAAINGKLTPQEKRSAIRIEGENAGRILASAGLMEQARGGRLDLELVPVGTGGAFDGELRIKKIRITEAPAIAALLNAISVVGLINELNGKGIRFSEINADFRLSPSQITLREGSAVGASLGLSMDGTFVPDTGAIEMQGVISPVYLLNAVGSVLTRPGEGLFGFNYSISGTADDPEVFVNPLTALMPAMLRNLFRRAEPEVPLEEGETAPKKEERRRRVVTHGEDR